MNLRSLVAMLPVTDMTRSLAFYQRLGFDLENDFVPPGEKTAVWAWLDGGGAMLMLNCAVKPLPPPEQRAIYYVYCADVPEKHGELKAAGIEVGAIVPRFYAPQGEFEVRDPDGYLLMFTHV
jgi:catechol 2,3-dioxygenase-like lactoylglutathione lyase family enzyme